MWSSDLGKNEALKMIKLSFSGPAIHMIENISVNEYLQSTDEQSANHYLEALQSSFISQSGKELSRIKFNMARQETDEPATLWSSRMKCLFPLAYPDQANNIDNNINIKDRFINGLTDIDQRRFALEQTSFAQYRLFH